MQFNIKGSTNSIVGIIKITHLNPVKLRRVFPPISTPAFQNDANALSYSPVLPFGNWGYVYLPSDANFLVIIISWYPLLYLLRRNIRAASRAV
jgi:hypothetical protein